MTFHRQPMNIHENLGKTLFIATKNEDLISLQNIKLLFFGGGGEVGCKRRLFKPVVGNSILFKGTMDFI